MLRRILKIAGGIAVALALAAAVLLFLVVQPVLFAGDPSGVTAVDPARLKDHVLALAGGFVPRDEAHPANLDRAAEYIASRLREAGGRVSFQPYEVDGRRYRNVTATFGRETSERIVVGAHYDAAGPFPGADDNASGVAGVIELASLLGKSVLPLTVELVAYTLEEPPHFRSAFMGSAVHARSMIDRRLPVRLMISLEMIGYFREEEGIQHLPSPLVRPFYPDTGDFIAVVGDLRRAGMVRRVKKSMAAATPLPVHSICAPPSLVAGIDWSDHLNYWNEGFAAVMITDTSFLRNPNYHTEHDTPGTLDYDRMARVVEGVYAAVVEAAE